MVYKVSQKENTLKHSPIHFLTIGLTALSLAVHAQEKPVLADAFKRVDKNGDGKLSADEVNGFSRLKDRLKGADKDGDGLITFDEFRRRLSAGTRSPTATASPVTRLGSGEHMRTITVGNLQRRYRVHVPKKYAADHPTPVIVVFHGGGGNPESMMRLTGMNAKSEEAGFIVVYPYGSGLDPERGLTFNGGGCCAYAMLKKIDDVGFTRALLDDLAKIANVDNNRVFATGLSNGGIMAHYVASELSDRIAAIAPVGGPLMMDACRPRRAVSVMHFHGTADEFAPFKGGFGKGALGGKGVTDFKSVDHSIQNWVKANGCDAKPEIVPLPDKANDGMRVTRKTWSGGKDGSEVVLIEIENGGHTWPGMDPPVAMLGKSTKDISANDLMWEFFQAHPLKPSAATVPATDSTPGSLKALPDSDATRDAAGTGQMFEAIHVPGFTDFREGLNGFAFGDFDHNGYLDILTITTAPFAMDRGANPIISKQGQKGFDVTGDVKRTYSPTDKIRLLMNYGGFRWKPHEIILTGSPAIPDDLSQGWRGAQVPAIADFNQDGYYDIFISRQCPMSGGKIRPGAKLIGCSFFLSDGAFHRFRDVSRQYGALNELAYNRQVSLGDVNLDGFLDIAIGADNIANAYEGVCQSALYVFQPKQGKFEGGRFVDIGGTELIPDFGGWYHDPARDKSSPNIVLRDVDNDGDLDLIQGHHICLWSTAPPTTPFSPAEQRQGVFTWKNLLAETGKFQFQKETHNGFAIESRLRYNKQARRFEKTDDVPAPGLSYLYFGDVNNNGYFDALLIGWNDETWSPAPLNVGGMFWYNQGGFRFKEATKEAGLRSLNNTYRDWYRFFQIEMNDQLRALRPSGRQVPSNPGIPIPHPMDRRALYGDAIFADYNNDGWLDIIVLDRREWSSPDWGEGIVIEARTALYLNRGDGTFEPKPTTFSGLDGSGISGEVADLNNDGLVDLIIAADPDNSGVAADARRYESMVYINTGLHGARENHWLRLRFSGITHARLLGARIEIFEPGTKKRLGTRGIYSNHSYKSSSALEAHFGLGKTRSVDIVVHLPGGEQFTVKNVQGDRYLNLNVAERTVREGMAHYDIYRAGFEEAMRLELDWFTQHLKKQP